MNLRFNEGKREGRGGWEGRKEKGPPSRGLADAPPLCWLLPRSPSRRPGNPSPTHPNLPQFPGFPTQSWADGGSNPHPSLKTGLEKQRRPPPLPQLRLWGPEGKRLGFIGEVPRN